MDCVFARVKRLRKNPIFKLISGHTLYEDIEVDLHGCVNYDPDHNLDEGNWFKIEEFSSQDFCLGFLKTEFNSVDFDDLPSTRFPDISYLFALQGEDFYFQKVSPSLLIRRKFIKLGEVAEIEEPQSRLVVKAVPDAIYLKQHDILVFRDIAGIASIFKGIDQLFREATSQEVESFLASSFIQTEDFTADQVSIPNRKRIALAMDTLSQMGDEAKVSLLSYINRYCEDKLAFDEENSRFTIGKDEDLKQLVYGIEQRFYTTHISREMRLANSVVFIGPDQTDGS